MEEREGTRAKLTALIGQVVTDYEVWQDGILLLEGGAIREVGRDESLLAEADEVYDYKDSILIPGFVDLQVNGAFGVDAASAPERLGELSASLLRTGTTAYLPTVISSPESFYEEVLPTLAEEIEVQNSGAEALGIHLEGPFLNIQKRGAHDEAHILQPNPDLLGKLLDLGPIRMLTIAPELDGADQLMEMARDRGVVVSAGHSDASFEVAYEAFDRRAASVTHLFNAMSSLHQREPGIPGAAFAHPRVVCGLIADGLHVHPEVVGLAFRMLGPDRVCLVTDATAATGMGPGEYPLATRTIYLDSNVTHLGSGSLAGSILTMNEAFQNTLAFTDCTIPEAVRMTSTAPARLVGEGRRKGRLTPGYDADIAILAPDLSIESVWRSGRHVYSTEMAG